MFKMDIRSNVITIPQYRSNFHHPAMRPFIHLSLYVCYFSHTGDFQVFFTVGMKIELVSTHNWACLSVLQEM